MISDLVEGLIPARRVHLLGGRSDAGKTRFILPAMLDFAAGKPFLGRVSRPVPWAYVVGDRLQEEAEDTIKTLGIDLKDVPMIPAFGKHNKTYRQIFEAAEKMTPSPKLLVIEGFGDLCGEKKAEIRTFLSTVGAYCQEGRTVIGIMESPKMRPKERYDDARQRISGVSAWGYHSSTVFVLEPVERDKDVMEPNRALYACVKNGQRSKFDLMFDERGQLRQIPEYFG